MPFSGAWLVGQPKPFVYTPPAQNVFSLRDKGEAGNCAVDIYPQVRAVSNIYSMVILSHTNKLEREVC